MPKFPATLALLLLLSFALQGEDASRIVLFPLRKATLSSEVDGVLRVLPFKEGAAIAKGDVIAELDARPYKENLIKNEAAVKEAQANVEFTRRNCEHATEMLSKGGMGRQEYEKTVMDKDVAAARLKFAEANCQTARLSLEACHITAPYDGHIVKKLASEWEYVKAGQPLLDVAEDFKLLAVVNLPSGEATRVKAGDKALFHIDETNMEIPGTLYERSGAVNPAGRSLEFKFLLDNKDGRLLPGMSGVLLTRQNP